MYYSYNQKELTLEINHFTILLLYLYIQIHKHFCIAFIALFPPVFYLFYKKGKESFLNINVLVF